MDLMHSDVLFFFFYLGQHMSSKTEIRSMTKIMKKKNNEIFFLHTFDDVLAYFRHTAAFLELVKKKSMIRIKKN